mmetsp:Transcript_12189/g.34586  ORF Transcript_12189/g.34586 Transcript_12189/m.34586 type:complete len:254 (-) Transcript_12189:561-1322(-)
MQTRMPSGSRTVWTGVARRGPRGPAGRWITIQSTLSSTRSASGPVTSCIRNVLLGRAAGSPGTGCARQRTSRRRRVALKSSCIRYHFRFSVWRSSSEAVLVSRTSRLSSSGNVERGKKTRRYNSCPLGESPPLISSHFFLPTGRGLLPSAPPASPPSPPSQPSPSPAKLARFMSSTYSLHFSKMRSCLSIPTLNKQLRQSSFIPESASTMENAEGGWASPNGTGLNNPSISLGDSSGAIARSNMSFVHRRCLR